MRQLMRLVIGITGASGSVYALRLLEILHTMGNELHVVATHSAMRVLAYECKAGTGELQQWADRLYDVEDVGAAIASGSFLVDAMVVVPCSMKTVGCLANGIADNLLTRAADVTLKEGRPLILVPRETPVHAIHLENMLKLARLGVRILPACPAFYHRPQQIDDLVDMMVGKICDALHIQNHLFSRWQEDSFENGDD
jgi:4-hydroxy-3-polyprenylbenzoate decarboxylase